MTLPPARILECSSAEYFADPCAVPSLSQSIAHTMVSESPRHAWLQHPRLGGGSGASSRAMDDGTIIHSLLLNADFEKIVVVNEDSFRTSVAKKKRDDAIAAGKLPIIAEKFEPLAEAARHLRGNCAALGFDFNGRSELAIEWSDHGEKGPVLCRSRMDHVFLEQGVIFDLKKTRSANPRYLRRNFFELGYDIQCTAYPRALERLNPELTGRVDFVFLFLEIEPPYSVVPARPDGAFREIGASRWSRAVHLWERCLARGHWPSYCDAPIVLDAPPWTIVEELGNAA